MAVQDKLVKDSVVYCLKQFMGNILNIQKFRPYLQLFIFFSLLSSFTFCIFNCRINLTDIKDKDKGYECLLNIQIYEFYYKSDLFIGLLLNLPLEILHIDYNLGHDKPHKAKIAPIIFVMVPHSIQLLAKLPQVDTKSIKQLGILPITKVVIGNDICQRCLMLNLRIKSSNIP